MAERRRLRAIFASSPDAIIVSDLNANVVDCNQETLKLTGRASKEEIIGRSSLEFIAEKDRNRALENLKKTFEQGTAKNVEYTLLKKDGEEYQGELSASIIKDSSDNLVGFVGVIRDITERKRLEQVLRKSEKQASAAIEAARALTFNYDIASGKVDWGGAIEEITGYAKEEFAKVDVDGWADRIHPDDRGRILSILKEATGKDRATAEYRFKTKKGYVTLSSISLTEKQDGKAARLVGILQDITERKKAEIALRESREKLRNIFESANDCIFYVDKSGRIIDVNRKAVQLFGRSRKELFGRHFAKVGGIPLKDMPTVMKAFARSLAGKQHTLNVSIKDKRGHGIPLECLGSLVKADGKITGMLVIARDITERKKAEEELRETKNYLNNLLNYANAPIIVWNNNKRITLFNNAFEAFTGYKKESMLERNIGVLFPPLQKEKILQTIEKATKGEKWKSVEIPILCKDKETKIALWNSANITDKEGKRISTIAQGQDITERKRAEKNLRESEEKFKILAEQSPNMVFVNKKGRVVYVNRKCEEIMGYRTEEFYSPDFDFLTLIAPEFKDLVKANFIRHMKGEDVAPYEYVIVSKEGKRIETMFSSCMHGEKVSRIRVYYKEAGKDQLKLVYEDDGVGIPKVEKERIFGEGYGKGTGHGLYLIRKMCEVYGWTIKEKGKQGKGAQFTITIPKTSVRFAPQPLNQTDYSHPKSKQASHHLKS